MIETRYGFIEGIDHSSYVEYRGIPYARPPVGVLGWKAPQPPERFNGVYQAVEFKCESRVEQKCSESSGNTSEDMKK